MSYIEKIADFTYILTVYVKPNSYQQKIEEDGKFLVLSLKSTPKKNKANKELIKLLAKKLDIPSTEIKFLAGMRAQDKKLEFNFRKKVTMEEIKERLLK